MGGWDPNDDDETPVTDAVTIFAFVLLVLVPWLVGILWLSGAL